MKLQFSLATLLVCMTVLAADLAACKAIKVAVTYTECREPTGLEVAQRFAWSAPLPLAATYCLIRRLKSRHHTGPPVG
jgi:hypothetical protein